MKVTPHKSIGSIEFGASQEVVVGILGAPAKEGKNRRGEFEIRYRDGVYRFDTNKLVEVSIDAKNLELGSVSVRFENLNAFIKAQDTEAFEEVGFLVSPRFGVALDPNQPSWVTLFPRERIALWRAV